MKKQQLRNFSEGIKDIKTQIKEAKQIQISVNKKDIQTQLNQSESISANIPKHRWLWEP